MKQAAADRPRGLRLPLQFFADTIGELRKVTWPSMQEARNLTFVVIVVSLAVGVLLGSLDKLFDLFIREVLVR